MSGLIPLVDQPRRLAGRSRGLADARNQLLQNMDMLHIKQ